jgi:trehalose-phosphatase
LRRLPGIRIENKGPIFTVHFRGAPPDAVGQAKATVLKIVEPRNLRLLTSKSAWEILPRDFKGKGAVVESLLSNSPPGTLAVYFGDDGPDEEAFQGLHDGVSVVVGRRSLTAARYYVRNSAEVKRILTKLEAAIA